ncbi:extracellular solute-binding protein [Plantactinospora solaniradicis]|uniref:Extracellular solute-binding protein n=1 Tax=Plantactinospora solaniradicis TaxID=1723736 RepID=A0ABW1K305_9ACTN
MTGQFGRAQQRTTISRAGFLRLLGGATAATAVPGLLAGCGGGSGSGDGKNLKMIGAGSQEAGLALALDQYKQQHPDVSINLSFAPADQIQTSVRAQLAAGNAPDLHAVYPGNGSAMSMVQISKAGLLADLSAQSWTQRIPTGFKGAYQNDGKTYIFSPGTSVLGAVYNKKAFAAAGVEPPTTWSELIRVCETLKRKGIVPIALGAQTPWVTQLINYALVPSKVYAKQPDFDDRMGAGTTSFAQSGWRDAMAAYLELQERGFFNDNPNGTTYEQSVSLVGTGKAGMAIQVSAVLDAFRKAAASPDDIAMFPMPGSDVAAENWIPGGIVVGIGVSAKSKGLEAAKSFVDFCAQPAIVGAWAKAAACVPLYADGEPDVDPVLKPFMPYLAENKAVPFMDQRWPNAQVQPTHFAVVQELLGGRNTIEGALTKMDEAYRKAS